MLQLPLCQTLLDVDSAICSTDLTYQPDTTPGELQYALDQLTLELREVLVAKFYEGLTEAQIARQRGIPESTVQSRLRAAKIRLRKLTAVQDFHSRINQR